MKIGLALNNKCEIPNHLYYILLKYCSDYDHQLFLITHEKRKKQFKQETYVFRLLNHLESKLSKARCKNILVHLPILPYNNTLDILICWGIEVDSSLIHSNTKIITFFINQIRFDTPYAGLVETIKNKDFNLTIKNREKIVVSLLCRPTLTYTRTKEISIFKLSRVLIKFLNSKSSSLVIKNYSNELIGYQNEIIISWSFAIFLMFILFIRNISILIYTKKKETKKSYWDIYIGENKGFSNFCTSPLDMNLIEHDNKRFWADPFLFKFKDYNYVFIEEYKYENRKGEIAVLKQNDKFEFEYKGVVLSQNYHLSYPFIIEIMGKQYMIPESGSKKRVDIFKCDLFPNKWTFYKTILSGYNYCDTTIYYYDNIFWIFTSAEKDGFHNDEQLLLFYTNDILNGVINEHPCNPIAIGPSNSRMAGSIFLYDQNMIRPAQDCSIIYGGSIRFMKIEKLTQNEYLESELIHFKPFRNYKGTHTYNQIDKLVITDAY